MGAERIRRSTCMGPLGHGGVDRHWLGQSGLIATVRSTDACSATHRPMEPPPGACISVVCVAVTSKCAALVFIASACGSGGL